MIFANRIEFLSFSSLDFNLKTCMAFEGDSGETESYLSREAVASETYRGEFRRIHNMKYSEVFSPKFTFIKNDFSDFTMEEARKVLKWLTGSMNASFLTVYKDDSEVITWEALGGFSECSLYKLGNGRTVGIVATFESAMPYALSALHTLTIDNPTIINIDTDEPSSPIYPRITIKQNSATDVIITNTYVDSNKNTKAISTKVVNNISGEVVTLDGANKVVSSSRANGRIFGDDFVNWTWLPLFDGKNTISVTGDCTVSFEWREPRKVGEF